MAFGILCAACEPPADKLRSQVPTSSRKFNKSELGTAPSAFSLAVAGAATAAALIRRERPAGSAISICSARFVLLFLIDVTLSHLLRLYEIRRLRYQDHQVHFVHFT